jgi:hypothetical protein
MTRTRRRAFRPGFDGLEGRQLLEASPLPDISPSAPATTVFLGHYYMAWRGTDNRINVESSPDGVNFDPNTKRTLSETTSAAPALATFFANGGKVPIIALAWTGTDHHLYVEYSYDGLAFDAVTKSTLGGTTLAGNGPALSPYGVNSGKTNGLAIAWTGTDNQLNVAYTTVNTFGGDLKLRFSPAYPLGQTSPYGPALAEDALGGLEIGWTGMDHQHRLNIGYLQSDAAVAEGAGISGGAITFGPSYTSDSAPSLAYVGDTLYYSWTGTDNRIHIGDLRDSGFTTLPAGYTSPYGPSLAAGSVTHNRARDRLWLAWTGPRGLYYQGQLSQGVTF